jgi:hypothetical protein
MFMLMKNVSFSQLIAVNKYAVSKYCVFNNLILCTIKEIMHVKIFIIKLHTMLSTLEISDFIILQ